MTPEEFCRWLKGYVEISGSTTISPQQWLVIKDHLNLVYNKVTPNRYVEPIKITRIRYLA